MQRTLAFAILSSLVAGCPTTPEPGTDAGPREAGPPCAVDSDCDDFNPCTEDTCVRLPPHYCTHTPVACADGSVARIDGGIIIP